MRIDVARDLATAARGRRMDLGLSQDDLAARAGVSRRWLSAFEAGKGSVELAMVLRVLEGLELQLRVDPVGGHPQGQTGKAPESLAEGVDLDAFLASFDEGNP